MALLVWLELAFKEVLLTALAVLGWLRAFWLVARLEVDYWWFWRVAGTDEECDEVRIAANAGWRVLLIWR